MDNLIFSYFVFCSFMASVVFFDILLWPLLPLSTLLHDNGFVWNYTPTSSRGYFLRNGSNERLKQSLFFLSFLLPLFYFIHLYYHCSLLYLTAFVIQEANRRLVICQFSIFVFLVFCEFSRVLKVISSLIWDTKALFRVYESSKISLKRSMYTESCAWTSRQAST